MAKEYTLEELKDETCQSFGGLNCIAHQCMFVCVLEQARHKARGKDNDKNKDKEKDKKV
jgi:hypothetical protein